MGRLRKRFNEKGRQSGIQKMLNLKKARLHRSVREQDDASPEHPKPILEEPQTTDSNVDVITDEDKKEKEERRRQLQDQLMKENEGTTMSSKKKKRLDKYIENKLKKETSAALMAKIAEERVDTSLLYSTKDLGKPRTAKERLQRSLLEEKKGLPISDPSSRLYTSVEVNESQPSTSDTSIASTPTNKSAPGSGLRFGFSSTSAPSGAVTAAPLKVLPPKRKRSFRWGKNEDFDDADHDSDEQDYLSTDSEEEDEADTGSDDQSLSEDSLIENDKEEAASDKNVNGLSKEVIEAKPVTEEKPEAVQHPDLHSEEFDLNSSEEEASADESDEANENDVSERANRFKSWATQQLLPGDSFEHEEQESVISAQNDQIRERIRNPRKLKRTEEDPDVLPVGVDEVKNRKTTYKIVNRPPEIQESRLALPIVAEEQSIMEHVFADDVVIVCGATGSGKTTQVPQFLFEAGFGSPESDTPGMIAVTQPRRVAAVSIAKRVAEELTGFSSKVSHQIRFDSTVNPETAIKFMTDGVLIRELSSDFLLSSYSAIIVDEAHERSVNTDILLGLLSRIVRLRREMSENDPKIKPLKLLIMSATLRVSDFAENKQLFAQSPPILKIDARQYPVSIHFNRTTKPNYIEDAYDKVCKIHNRLPAGAILVFLTGQQEVEQLCSMLRKRFIRSYKPQRKQNGRVAVSRKEISLENEDIQSDNEDEEKNISPKLDAIELDKESEPMHVLPLYSLLTTENQLKVFEKPPEGHRMCIVATNIAETSITIPNVRYVVDCGKAKERVYNEHTSVQKFEVSWISKANADQRAGRAGRTGPGHCYRLYSSAVYDREFSQHSLPEILRVPVESIVLQMKSMNIDNVANFPYPTAPSRASLQKALQLLSVLGAIDREGQLTKLGEQMSLFPLSPRFSKMLIIGQQHGCLPYVIALVAALSINQLFVSKQSLLYDANRKESVSEETEIIENEDLKQREEHKNRLRGFYNALFKFQAIDTDSPALRYLSAVCAYDYAADKIRFCKENYLLFKALEEVFNLRKQLINLLKRYLSSTNNDFTKIQLKPPSDIQIKALRQFIASSYIDQIASYDQEKGGYVTLFPCGAETARFVPDTSPNFQPQYAVYQRLHESSTGRVYMEPLTSVTGQQLARLAKNSSLISYSKPLSYPPIRYIDDGVKRECYVIPILSSHTGSGGASWNLPAEKVLQKRTNGRWETVQ
ncbi:ATP-dependent RNA helicase Dhr1 [Schizosaccharomyces cryophilus OY26]|uniref:RNA helicase n=1 Tax=Schizosaccharomyces cryophilus (strain OY26 / ATCC MYA-4695 / CBS 11777 / NBRC 106824 / NRRL Y48691) TaxID=653667 RepID=S9X7B4_SCHCR|nr:ATP-dependent RNA helicase Dhr1 [Schizosaccharomyces cryophilus OY26]EPY52977.1 ATP-dependent RNA helicase Dhr1 [Schizosaccharomyces cryophilus OY26]